MKYLITLFGVLIMITALVMLFRPAFFIDHMRRFSDTTAMHVLAVMVRVILGMALLLHAEQSRFPLVLQIIGWVSLAAAAIIAVIPHARFTSLIGWVLDRFTSYIWAGALTALPFGGFLVYAVL